MKFIQFLIENKTTLLPFAGLVFSELLSLNPKLKSNGLIQLIGNILKGESK
jgi:hypothetical protein